MFGVRKLESYRLQSSANCLMMSTVVLTQYARVTDRRTDTVRQHITRYAYASRGKMINLQVLTDNETVVIYDKLFFARKSANKRQYKAIHIVRSQQ